MTPFIAILRNRLKTHGTLDGTRLIFGNKRQHDIIYRDEFENMPGLDTAWVLSDDIVPGIRHGEIDGSVLDDLVDDFSGTFYLCGPPPMEESVSKALRDRGVEKTRLITEE